MLCIILLAAERLELRAGSYPARPAVASLWLLRSEALVPGLGLGKKFCLVHEHDKVIFQRNASRLLKEKNQRFLSLAAIPRSSAVIPGQPHTTSEEPCLLIKNYKSVKEKLCPALSLS